MRKWRPLVVLAGAQFLMVLDSAVMNVSISQLVDDFDTEVTAIQAVITFYSLVMAATMITGGKIGDLLGRRRAFRIGLVIYGAGSLLTAASLWMGIGALFLGWSVLEGLGAALVLPTLAALVGGTYEGRDRAVAYGMIGGVAGAGVAVGPIVGGYFTANLDWRWVFVGEAVIVVVLLVLSVWLTSAGPSERQQIDGIGAVLSATGLALIVYGVLQSSSWGWLRPRNSPIEPLGFSLTPFVVAAGGLALWLFTVWQRSLEANGRTPLVRLKLMDIRPLRAGLEMLLAQNLVLLGLFFAIPLYLQVSQGLDALESGIRLLPVSILMLVFSLSGPLLLRFLSPRQIVRIGLVILFGAGIYLVATIQPELDDANFAASMALLGVGMGLLASQLGNVVQSSVGEADRSQVGGLQYTAQNLGSALGTALVGAILLNTMTASFESNIVSDERISSEIQGAVGVELQAGVPFVSTEAVEAALANTDIPANEQVAVVENYEDSQMEGLKVAVFGISGLALVALLGTRHIPSRRKEDEESAAPEPAGL
jgi:MFS family permease